MFSVSGGCRREENQESGGSASGDTDVLFK